MTLEVVLAADGSARMIYSDDGLEVLQALGPVTIRRASHVEPGADGLWYADMAPVEGPVLGPFTKRAAALAAEVEWLKAAGIPQPK